MKTTLPLHHPVDERPAPARERRTTLRLGVVVSAVAALVAVVVDLTVHAPAIVVVAPVVVVGFALSWHASGHGHGTARRS